MVVMNADTVRCRSKLLVGCVRVKRRLEACCGDIVWLWVDVFCACPDLGILAACGVRGGA